MVLVNALAALTGIVSLSGSLIFGNEVLRAVNSNTDDHVTYNMDYRRDCPFTIKNLSSDYQEITATNVWSKVDTTLSCHYVYDSDYSYSRLTFSTITLVYTRLDNTTDTLYCSIDKTFNIDGLDLSQYVTYLNYGVVTDYTTQAFQCLFYISADLNGTNLYFESGNIPFQVDDEFAYNYMVEMDVGYNFSSYGSYSDGFSAGSSEGYSNGYSNGYSDGYGVGSQVGYNNGLNAQGVNANFLSLFGAIADTPVFMIRSLFSFDIFGISSLTIFMSLLTVLVVIYFIRKVV